MLSEDSTPVAKNFLNILFMFHEFLRVMCEM
jgi:hypothetical protein